MLSFFRHPKEFNWNKYLGLPPATRMERLLEDCRRLDVSIHVDSPTEMASVANTMLRSTASEAELERRISVKLALNKSTWANRIAGLSLLVSVISLAISIWKT